MLGLDIWPIKSISYELLLNMTDMDAFVHVKGCGVSSVEYHIRLVGVNSYSPSNCCTNGVFRLHTM